MLAALMHLERRRETSGTTSLPGDLLREQALRIEMLYAVGVLLWVINLLMDIALAPQGDRGPYRLWIEIGAAAVAAGAAAFVHFGRASHRMKIHVGVACIVPHALALALLNSWVAQPTTMRPISGITVLILFFGMLAPARPALMLAAGLVAATMDPLGVWIAHLRGLPVPSAVNTLLMFYPNYVCALLTMVPAQVMYRIGRQLREARALGSYQLVELLGKGGMGEVWLARHRLLARSAAIKLVRPETIGHRVPAATTMARFEREAQATAALSSPHTIRLFDFGLTDEGAFYYVMELLQGRDLESLVREFGPLPEARAMHFVKQVCRSLAEAHAVGLVHRDVKPANIYACRMGVEYDFAKVLDFGLVKLEDHGGTTMLTAEQRMIGTPAYIAPEVILGEHDADRRADVYSLGCVAYYLLTGERVFETETPMKMLMRHVDAKPLPPSLRTEQPISANVDALVLACLQKDPARRPQDTEVLFRMASACGRSDNWSQDMAERWWAAHLPQFTAPSALAMPASAALSAA
jgi:eukaryotic-like serine/threonine-protein kinase